MRNWIALLVLASLSSACANAAEDCNNTLTCPLPPDASMTVVDAGGPTCDGECVPVNESGWQEPWLLWLGYDRVLAPQCPEQAPTKRDYYAPLPAPPCGACGCDAPTGSCSLPATADANSAACPAASPGTAQTSFDAPSAWDGSCTAEQAIAANLDCGGAPCVQSVTFASLVLSEAGCAPKPPVVPHDNPKTLTLARTCAGATRGYCADSGHACTPGRPKNADKPGFWTYCVAHEGADDAYTMTCPLAYPRKHVFSIDYFDARTCTSCTCGPPEGSDCTSTVSVYEDNACSTATELGSVAVSSALPVCLDLLPGSPLGSKAATPPLYEPGSCQPSGGEPTGDIEKIGPVTFCCQD